LEKGESAEECMKREAREESSLEVNIVKSGPLIEFIDEYGRAVAIPFIIESSGKVALTEHSESRWIRPADIVHYRAVPDLLRALEAFGLISAHADDP